MSVRAPKDRTYYYECSNGTFRLTLFLPTSVLEEMAESGQISKGVLDDFPDGVDLDCTEPDFADFEAVYGYRPEQPADQLRAAFFALFSTTRDWQSFRGTGFVRADEIEQTAEKVHHELASADLAPRAAQPRGPSLSFGQRRERAQSQIVQQKRTIEFLTGLKLGDVNPKKTIQEQAFAQVPMEEGRSVQEVFRNLHQRNRGKR